jgi:hypothetical protein
LPQLGCSFFGGGFAFGIAVLLAEEPPLVGSVGSKRFGSGAPVDVGAVVVVVVLVVVAVAVDVGCGVELAHAASTNTIATVARRTIVRS